MTIKTKPATADYRNGYDRIFSKLHDGMELSQANLQKVCEEIHANLRPGETITLKPTRAGTPFPSPEDVAALEKFCCAPKAPE